jgi:hypothetical protein
LYKSDKSIFKNENDSETVLAEDQNKPSGSFAYFLYSTLKLENLAAVVSLGEEWYGAIHCMLDAKSDAKKKLNLALSVFTPGVLP